MRHFALVFLVIAVGAAQAADIAFPPLTGRVVDQANILSASAEAGLSEALEAHERATSQQVVVAAIASLDGQAIEEYAVALGRAWGIGEKGRNTGVILLVAPNDRQVRVEIGYGLEWQLTDALSRVIIERDILPRFRAGQMEAGVIAGAEAILAVLRGDDAARPQTPPSAPLEDPGEIPLLFILILFFLFARFGRRRGRGLWPLLLGGPVIWHGGGRRGGGSGGGGFRGGGGSFGGGGASGRW